MKPTFIAVLLPLLMACTPLSSVAGNKSNFTQQVSEVLKESDKIKPGMKRDELLKIYTPAGGISDATRRTFVNRHCVYIKLDVEFELAENQASTMERPSDRILKISKPYLAWSIID